MATVLAVEPLPDRTRVTITLDRPCHPPIWPALLLEGLDRVICQFDRLVSEAPDLRFVFDAFVAPGTTLASGGRYIFRGLFTADALELVTDTSREWIREPYPDNGDHDHCALTWARIAADEGDGCGYRSGSDWISVEAFELYIKGDRLRVRSQA
jgi:hypothetical protein